MGEQVQFRWETRVIGGSLRGQVVRVLDIVARKGLMVQMIEVKANTGYYSWLQRTWDNAIRIARLEPRFGAGNVGTTVVEVEVESATDVEVVAVRPVSGATVSWGGLFGGGGIGQGGGRHIRD